MEKKREQKKVNTAIRVKAAEFESDEKSKGR
jgi:hypothetical protein